MEIDASFAPFHADADCTIQPQSLIGDRFVQCSPGHAARPGAGGPGRLPADGPGREHAHARRPRSRPVDLRRAGHGPASRIIFSSLGTGFAGRPAELEEVIRRSNPALGETKRLLGELDAERQTIGALVDESDRILAQLAGRKERIGDFVDAADSATKARPPSARTSRRRSAICRRCCASSSRRLDRVREIARDGDAGPRRPAGIGAARSIASPELARLRARGTPGARGAGLGLRARHQDGRARRSRRCAASTRSPRRRRRRAADRRARSTSSARCRASIEGLQRFLYYAARTVARYDGVSHLAGAYVFFASLCSLITSVPIAGCDAHFDSFDGPSRAARRRLAASRGAGSPRLRPRSAICWRSGRPDARPACTTPAPGRGAGLPQGAAAAAPSAPSGGPDPAAAGSRPGTRPVPVRPAGSPAGRDRRSPRLPAALMTGGRRGPQTTRRSLTSNPVMVGAVTVLVALVAVFLSYNANRACRSSRPTRSRPRSRTRPSWCRATRSGSAAAAWARSIDVRRDRRRRRPTARSLDLKLDKTSSRSARDTTLLIRQRSNLGLKYVELTPGRSGEQLPPRGTLALAQARAVVDLDDVLNVFDAAPRRDRSGALAALGTGVAGRGLDSTSRSSPSRQRSRALDPVARNLSDPTHRPRGSIRGFESATAAVAPVRRASPASSTPAPRRSRALASERGLRSGDPAEAPPTELVGDGRPAPRAPGARRHRGAHARSAARVAELPRAGDRARRARSRRAPPSSAAQAAGRANREARSPSCAGSPATRRPRGSLHRPHRSCTGRSTTLAFANPFQTVCNYLGLWTRNTTRRSSQGDRPGGWFRAASSSSRRPRERHDRPTVSRPARQPVSRRGPERPVRDGQRGLRPGQADRQHAPPSSPWHRADLVPPAPPASRRRRSDEETRSRTRARSAASRTSRSASPSDHPALRSPTSPRRRSCRSQRATRSRQCSARSTTSYDPFARPDRGCRGRQGNRSRAGSGQHGAGDHGDRRRRPADPCRRHRADPPAAFPRGQLLRRAEAGHPERARAWRRAGASRSPRRPTRSASMRSWRARPQHARVATGVGQGPRRASRKGGAESFNPQPRAWEGAFKGFARRWRTCAGRRSATSPDSSARRPR